MLTWVEPDERLEQFVVWQDDQALAWSRVFYELRENTHVAMIRIVVHPKARRVGLGTRLWAAARKVAVRESRTVILGMTSSRSPAGEAFARHVGAEAALPNRQSELDLEALDAGLLTLWKTRPDGDPYQLHVWHTIPDEYLERMAEMMMVMNTAPRGDLDVEDSTVTPQTIRAGEAMDAGAGYQHLRMAVEDVRSGQLDGFTEMFYQPERAVMLYQGATAVRPAARGQGLGKWLKAAMLERARTEFPLARCLRTDNAEVNDAMLGINVALGFKECASNTSWQLKLS